MNKSLHFQRIEKLLRANPNQLKLGHAGILLGARFGPLSNECDNCKTYLRTYTVVILKPIPPRQHHTIKILCSVCQQLHKEEVKYYLYLNK